MEMKEDVIEYPAACKDFVDRAIYRAVRISERKLTRTQLEKKVTAEIIEHMVQADTIPNRIARLAEANVLHFEEKPVPPLTVIAEGSKEAKQA